MQPREITDKNTSFLLLSFEGPDIYSQAGGLGVRVTELAGTLAGVGFPTSVIFVGDPKKKSCETSQGGKLTLYRWSQWVSKYYPEGVYQGEDEKLYDFNESVPQFVIDSIARPAVEEGRMLVILGEEWHTAEAMCRISDALYWNGIRDKALLLWNANNTMSFHRINWGRLSFTNTITTVSRYMKHIMWGMGVNPLVIPNGIPARLLQPVDPDQVRAVREALGGDLMFFKIGRFDPDKRWNMAVEAIAYLKAMGIKVKFPLRGGIEPHEGEVMHNARSRGLIVKDVRASGNSFTDYLRALREAGDADIYNLKFYLPEEFVRVLYAAADGVLANSGHEPFGLVGLETMAAGGIAYTGCTGEDYAVCLENAIVLETSDPREIFGYALYLVEHPEMKDKIRAAARDTAQQYVWEEVIENLIAKLEFLARNQGFLASPTLPGPENEEAVAETEAKTTTGVATRRRRARKAAEAEKEKVVG